MYELEKFGSFHVGGRLVEVEGKPKRTIWFTETNSHEQDPNGKFLIEQLYVQYFIPKNKKFDYPLVLLHGGGLTGACWETTPDGRPGWLNEFLLQGFAVYVIDNVERGRSGFCAVEGVWEGDPIPRTLDEAWDIFRFGPPDGYKTGTTFQGQRFPLQALEAFQKLKASGSDFIYVHFGEGELSSELSEQVINLGLEEHIYFFGFKDNVSAYLSWFDCLVFPSIKEGLPYAILEAGGAGIPVFASRVGGIPEIILDAETGRLHDAKDVATLADQLIDFINNAKYNRYTRISINSSR